MKMKLSKKEFVIGIVLPLIAFVIGALAVVLVTGHAFKKESSIVENNRIGGCNQLAVRQLPAVRSFEEYLGYIETKDTTQMWNHCSSAYQSFFGNAHDMFYAYYLTASYEIKYVIPISENSFYAYMRFEDEVLEWEVVSLKEFHNIIISEIDNEYDFERVLDEVYSLLDSRFVVDSAEYVKEELRKYMLNMSIKDYITMDWRFPMVFAQHMQLPIKPLERNRMGIRLGHEMFCFVRMDKVNDGWKLDSFRTVAISRW